MSSVIPVDDEWAFSPATVIRLALPALVFLLVSHPTFAINVPFASQSVLSTLGDGAYSVSAADVDGDGDLDVVSSSFNDNTIVWFENNGSSPPVWTRRIISTTAMGAYWSFAADVDGDGDTDVLSASFADDRIAWYENDGASPPAWTTHTISTTADGARSVYAADLDGDGDMDVLSASINDSRIVWYENTTASRFGWIAHTISQVGVAARSVFAADVDGDGDLDVLAAFSDTDQISWYENLGGTPLAWTARTITTSADGAQAVFAADLDGDGDTDVLSASILDDTIAWYENDGAVPPSFTKIPITTTADGAWGVYAADVDSDGDLDLLSASAFDGRIYWYENRGTSPPTWNTYLITTLAVGARSVSAADLDGDGDVDILSADFDDDKVSWYENRTIHRSAGFFEQKVISTAADYVESVFAADVDGDGDMDALSASEIDDKIAWYPNLDGAGTFGPQQVITTSADSARSVYAADVDGDGDMDALSASVNDDKIAWYENLNGAGTSWQTHVISTSADGAVKVFAADVDGDGDVDALSISNFDNKVAWYENVGGAGDVWSEHVIATDAAGGWGLFAADVDGDGDIDVMSAAGANNTFAWYENSGVGTSWTEHVISTVRAYPISIAAADIDGDGDADALTATYSSHTLAWHEHTNGGGPPWVEHVIDTTAQGFWMATAADLDHDGDLDVVAVLYPDHLVVRYENLDGAGTFGPQKVIAPSLYLFTATTADFDGDGDRDVLTGSGTDLIAWYPNQGGQFSLDTSGVGSASLTPGAINPVLKIQVNHRGRTNDSALELATLELLFEQSPGLPLTTTQANSLIENLYVYRDNGDGLFGPGDVSVASIGTLSLTAGRQTVTFVDGDPNVQVPATEARTFFVALDVAAGASGQTPNDFRVTESSNRAEDVSSDQPLSLEFVPNFSTGLIGLGPRVSSVVPQANTLQVPVGTNVTVVFSERVNPGTVDTTSFRLLDPLGTPVAASVGLAPDGRTATLDPTPPGGALAFNTVYTVEVTNAVKDLAGIPAVPFKSYFATAAGPIAGIALPTVADQSVLPSPPPGPGPGGASTAASLLTTTLGPNLGYSVSPAGDLNNDQLADFVGGAPGYSLTGKPEAGAVAIYLGSNAPEPSSGNHPREIPDVIYTGQEAHDRAGSSVASGFDFDGDGIGDILIGAEQVNRSVSPEVATGTGKVYLIYFRPQEYDLNQNGTPDYQENLTATVSLSQVGTTITGAVLTGVGSGDQAGYAVAAGGLLGKNDTHDGVVIGAPGANGGNGKVYVLFSQSGVIGATSLGNVGVSVPGLVYVGSAGERLGASVALPGDVIAPMGPDIAMGAPLADTTPTQVHAGRVYVAAAGSLVAGTVNASSIPTQVQGDQACEALGFAVAGGGDNRASGTPQLPGGDPDLLIGAPYYDTDTTTGGDTCLDTTLVPNAGRVIQTTGRLPASVIGASQVGVTVEGVIWRGVQARGGLGWSVGRLGDLSGNHLDDIGLSAPFVSPGMSGAGAVYVVEGSANTGLLGSIKADQVGQVVSGGIFLGTQTDEEAGLALCAAGDLDGDGLTGSPTADDFAVGSPGWDASLGTVHQVLGTLLQQPGECTSLGCTVADLQTGAVLVVPPNAIATGLKYRFALQNAPSLNPSCGIHPTGKTVVGWTSYTRTDCSTPPCTPPGLAIGPNLEVPTRQELEYQLSLGESLDLRYCDTDTGLGWRSLTTPTTGQVQANTYVAGRKAVKASGVDTLRLYGVLFNDQDHDEVRDTCDCGPQNASIWSAPGPAGNVTLSGQSPSPTTITWAPPDCPGGSPSALLYDTIRSTNRADFVNGAVCVETNGTDLTSTDSQNPPVGQAFYYIVSPENGCSSGGTCQLPACVQTPARDC